MIGRHGNRLIFMYATTVTLLLVLATVARGTAKNDTFDEITVQRINIVEPDGTRRMVISNHAQLPGVIVRGTEGAPNRPGGGMLFYNDEGSENGGLIFAGHRNANGDVIDSGESLSFDKYGANGQLVQLAGINDRDDQFAGLRVWGYAPSGARSSRVWVGHTADGAASMALMDEAGRKRIVMEVKADGTSSLSFLDATGKIVNQLSPTAVGK